MWFSIFDTWKASSKLNFPRGCILRAFGCVPVHAQVYWENSVSGRSILDESMNSGVSGLYGPIKLTFFSRDWTSLKLHWIHYLQKTEKSAKKFGCIFAEAFKNNQMEKQLFFQEIFQAKSHFPETVTFPKKCFKWSIVPLILNVHLDNFGSYTFGILSKALMAFVTNRLSYCFLDFICILALIVIIFP